MSEAPVPNNISQREALAPPEKTKSIEAIPATSESNAVVTIEQPKKHNGTLYKGCLYYFQALLIANLLNASIILILGSVSVGFARSIDPQPCCQKGSPVWGSLILIGITVIGFTASRGIFKLLLVYACLNFFSVIFSIALAVGAIIDLNKAKKSGHGKIANLLIGITVMFFIYAIFSICLAITSYIHMYISCEMKKESAKGKPNGRNAQQSTTVPMEPQPSMGSQPQLTNPPTGEQKIPNIPLGQQPVFQSPMQQQATPTQSGVMNRMTEQFALAPSNLKGLLAKVGSGQGQLEVRVQEPGSSVVHQPNVRQQPDMATITPTAADGGNAEQVVGPVPQTSRESQESNLPQTQQEITMPNGQEAGTQSVQPQAPMSQQATSSTGFSKHFSSVANDVKGLLAKVGAGKKKAAQPEDQQIRMPLGQQPGVSATQQPGMPMAQQPGMPMAQQPGMPMSQQPGMPMSQQPGMPMPQQPGIPMLQEPGMPMSHQPGIPMSQQPGISMSHQPGMPMSHQPGMPMTQQPGMPMIQQPEMTMAQRSAMPIEHQGGIQMQQQPGIPNMQQYGIALGTQQPGMPFSQQSGMPLYSPPSIPMQQQPGLSMAPQSNMAITQQGSMPMAQQPGIPMPSQHPMMPVASQQGLAMGQQNAMPQQTGMSTLGGMPMVQADGSMNQHFAAMTNTGPPPPYYP